MLLQCSLRPVLPVVPTSGPHQLAWAAMSDAIFSDAYHAGIGEIVAYLPFSQLEDGFRLRADLTTPKGSLRALVSSGIHDIDEAVFDRVYTVEHGGVVRGRILTRTSVLSHTWRARHQLWFYTLRSRAYGVPIRIGLMLRNHQFADQMSYKSRRSFVSRRPAIAYYHVTVWEPIAHVT